MKDNFSTDSDKYSRYRPRYPQALFDFILSLVPHRGLAWDCGTGNGQTAAVLAEHFEQVIATDLSQQQLEHAVQKPNIIYRSEYAQKSSLKDDSADLITVSQALHWFDLHGFYAEVSRVSKPGGVLAVWTYNLLQCDPYTDDLILEFYHETLNGFWDPERAMVDDGYTTIPFPFKEVATPVFQIHVQWTAEDLGGYLRTWSAVKKFISQKGFDPVDKLMADIINKWPEHEARDIYFPVYLRAGRVH